MNNSPEAAKPAQLRRLTYNEMEVLGKLHKAAQEMSFYNAGEGSQYRAEGSARGSAATELSAARADARALGFDLGSGYLC